MRKLLQIRLKNLYKNPVTYFCCKQIIYKITNLANVSGLEGTLGAGGAAATAATDAAAAC